MEPVIMLEGFGYSGSLTDVLELRDGRIVSWSYDKTLRI